MPNDMTNLWMLLQIHRELVGHPKLKIIVYWKTPAGFSWKTGQHLFNQSRLAIPDIDPLSKTTNKSSCVWQLRADRGKEVLMAVQQFNAARYLAHHQVVLQLLEKLARYAGI